MCISVYKWESILEIYNDAQTFGLRSVNSLAVRNSSLAISWLEATFPEVAQETIDEGDLPALKAHPHALFDSSVSLQVYVYIFRYILYQMVCFSFLFFCIFMKPTHHTFYLFIYFFGELNFPGASKKDMSWWGR